MNIDFENALSRLANDPTDLIAWSVILDAFQTRAPNTRTVNYKSLTQDIILSLASSDFRNQGTTTTVLHGNAAGNPSWAAIGTNDLANSSVTFAKTQDISTSRILGRLTAGSGTIEQLTGTQLTTLLDLFSTSTTTKGLVPGSNGAGNTYFLRADGSWAVPQGVGTGHSSLAQLDYASAGHTGFEPTISAGTVAQYYRGDKTWQNLEDAIIAAATSSHNDLTGLEGGDGTHYYHLSATNAPLVGYAVTTTADAVPTGLTCSSTGTSIGADGSVSAYVVLTWNAIATNTFDHYVVRYKKGSYTYYTYLNSNTNTITIEGLTPNISYNFGVASVNKYGIVSAYSANITQTSASDSSAPATVANVSATGGIQYVIVEWDSNSESDLDSYNIYRNTINDSATATLIGNTYTNYFVDGGRTGGQIYYYFIKAVDTSGNASAAFSTEAHATPRNVESNDIVTLAANKVLIDGAVYLSNWRHSSDITKIDGGSIYTGSITTSQLNFTPTTSSNVIASINASPEGIQIDADNFSVSGSSVFTAKVGGTYASAGSGARVLLFPDANTGIQIIDDGGNDVFKALISGANVGDVTIGNYAAGQGIFYDKSANTTTFAGTINAINSRVATAAITAGDLDGAVSTVTPNQTAQSQIDTITLTGTNGTANVSCNGLTRLATFGVSLGDTASNFLSSWEADFAAVDVALSVNGADIIFTSDLGVSFSPSASISNVSGDLSGTYSDTQAAQAAVAQVDHVTLSGSSGYCTLNSNGVSSIVTCSYATGGANILNSTAADHVTAFASLFAAGGITLTASNNVLILTASTPGTPIAPATTSVNAAAAVGNIHMIGNSIFESTVNTNFGTIYINDRGYLGGASRYRNLEIGNGQGTTILKFYGLGGHMIARVPQVSSPTTFSTGTIYVDASGFLKLV